MWYYLNLRNTIIFFKSIYNLGLDNCLRVILYRTLVRISFYKTFNKISQCPIPIINLKIKNNSHNLKIGFDKRTKQQCLDKSNLIINGFLFYFGERKQLVGKNPDWFFDFKNNINFLNSKYHWSECKHFTQGDIKESWEISRWNWAISLARAYKISGQKKYIIRLNELINSWCINNPINSGINWLCGQEVSLRLLNALLTWKIIGHEEKGVNNEFKNLKIIFVKSHLKRINQTFFYARAQNNNHWITEAAALFIGGSWLMQNTNEYFKEAEKWSSKGRKNLEISIKKLVLSDGSFPQHSLTYHRFVLDLLCQVEIWRRYLQLPEFSIEYQKKFSLLLKWITYFIDKQTGNGPNLGSNDGTFCFQLHDLSYRDFRPTLQLASIIDKKYKNCLFPPGPWDEPIYWFELLNKEFKEEINITNKILPQGGYIVLRSFSDSNSWGFLRLPKYKVRPSQNDPFHFDFWIDGVNVLRDGGTFSYNASDYKLNYFTGIQSHNSIEFQDSQMIRFSRFLLGNKIKYKNKIDKIICKNYSKFKTEYTFGKNSHSREIVLNPKENYWEINDSFYSSKNNIILRWRLDPSDWRKTNNFVFKSKRAKLSIISKNKILSCKLKRGLESLNYGEINEIPVIEVIISGYEGKIKTIINIL